jgi:DNA-binding IclR family transcriptional regulator
VTPSQLAKRTGTNERYVREWLSNQAASGYVEYDPAGGTFRLPPEQAMALADESSRRSCPARSRSSRRWRRTRRRSPSASGPATASAGTSTTRRVTFEVAGATEFGGGPFNLVLEVRP